ncbi:hypothetical protein ACWEKT_09725 [Nocardia takedensis]|uniref:hypothetical protein n=1 Tax=Nocardia takedensis TaxID=259390 RepID=UPI0002E52741|nr:hypothetical protein [Nocardia takedensis]
MATAATAVVTGLLFVGACSNQVTGTAEVNQTDLAAYQSDMTASSIAASTSRAAATRSATVAACASFATANEASVSVFNAYIAANNTSAPDTDAKAGAAVGTLRDSARAVDRAVNGEVQPDIAQKLHAYRDDTNALADTLERRPDIETLNASIDRFNNTKNLARDGCRAF